MNLDEFNYVTGSTAEEFAATGLENEHRFPWQILQMNRMYDLPVNQVATLDGLGENPVQRMQGFLRTLQKEMNEGLQILAYLSFREWLKKDVQANEEQLTALVQKVGVADPKMANDTLKVLLEFNTSRDVEEFDRQILVSIADWLGDMTVYNRSEALKFGLPLESVLAIIMGSNFTKLGEDGLPIKNADGKVEKGPNFVPPEQHIYSLLFDTEELIEEFNDQQARLDAYKAVTVPVLVDPMAQVFQAEEGDDEGEEEDDEDSDYVEDTPQALNGTGSVFHE